MIARAVSRFARVVASIAAAFVGASIWSHAPAATTCTLDRATSTTIDRKPFIANGYGVRWNLATDRIVFMYQSPSGYYRLATIRPDGSDRRDFPDDQTRVPNKHRGSPHWHPSGRFVIFIAQKEAWTSRALFGAPDYEAMPGFGRHDDLWISSADGKRSWQLTHDANTRDQGILIPVFHRMGTASRGRHGKRVGTICFASQNS